MDPSPAQQPEKFEEFLDGGDYLEDDEWSEADPYFDDSAEDDSDSGSMDAWNELSQVQSSDGFAMIDDEETGDTGDSRPRKRFHAMTDESDEDVHLHVPVHHGYAFQLSPSKFTSVGMVQPIPDVGGPDRSSEERSSRGSTSSSSVSSSSSGAEPVAKPNVDHGQEPPVFGSPAEEKTTESAQPRSHARAAIRSGALPRLQRTGLYSVKALGILDKWGFNERLGKHEQGIAEPLVIHPRRSRQMGISADDIAPSPESSPIKQASGCRFSHESREGSAGAMRPGHTLRKSDCHPSTSRVAQERAHGTRTFPTVAHDEKPEKELQAGKHVARSSQGLSELLRNVDQLIKKHKREDAKHAQAAHAALNTQNRVEIKAKETHQVVENTKLHLEYVESLLSLLRSFQASQLTIPEIVRLVRSLPETPCQLDTKHDLMSCRDNLDKLVLELSIQQVKRSLGDVLNRVGGTTRASFAYDMAELSSLFGGTNDRSTAVLFMRGVLPAIRDHISAPSCAWDPRRPDVLIGALQATQPAMPDEFMEVLAKDLVVPRLQAEILSWDPMADQVPVHAWLFVWLPLLGKRNIRPLFEPFCLRISPILVLWRPFDLSLLRILKPWQAVVEKHSWRSFVDKAIVPKLLLHLQKRVDAAIFETCAKELNVLQAWDGLIPTNTLSDVLLDTFVPVWLHVLLGKIKAPDVDLAASSAWHSEWRKRIPSALRETDAIKVGFLAGLDMINMALGEHIAAGASEWGAASFLHHRLSLWKEPARAQSGLGSVRKNQPTASKRMASAANDDSLTLRELVQKYAEKLGVEMVPSGRNVNGNTVYLFASKPVYIDASKRLIFAQRRGSIFEAIDLEELKTL
ncbi:Tuftelin-interacting protein 11 [Porphyridium purpureum]|uniref:Tuftelin-interacting protein 11 n=1 Tax=Porphyridium purpureum TaxID=35688 RepID=A0A5J4YQK8_PORPP|nr:Tuftelin-interacting protein 11 [Porphyridium purpureum]|eukprot:POR5777..scf236_6